MSEKDRDKLKRKEERAAFRKAERVIDSVNTKSRELKADRDRLWKEAREYLKSGNKSAARRTVQAVRARELLMDQLEKRKIVSQEKVTKLSVASTDAEFTKALAGIIDVVNIDPDELAMTLDGVNDTIDEQKDNDRIWNSMFEKDMQDAEYADSDIIDSVDGLFGMLEDEVAFEIGGVTSESEMVSEGVDKEIGKAADRLRNLMEDDK